MVSNLIAQAQALGASDIHLVCGLPARARVDGEIRDIGNAPLTAAECLAMAEEINDGPLPQDVGEVDLARTFNGTRCRVNLFRQQGCWSAAIRILNENIPAMDSLGLPSVAFDVPGYNQGLVLITGETGSGKSTTLASIIDQINQTQAKHILTLEEPIEYIYTPVKSIVNQREVGKDTASFSTGLRAALREDPDVILVGEMRDLETIETALTAAETGHLVFGTVHTNSAADSIDRIVDVFPAERQQQIRLQLSMTLKLVISQQLVPKLGGGRVLCAETMKVNDAISNLIREGKTPQIVNAIQTSGAIGNILMDKSLQNLLSTGVITREVYDGLTGGSSAQDSMLTGKPLFQSQRQSKL